MTAPGAGARLVLMADTHLPKRARDLPEELWRAVDGADVVIHAGDWVEVSLLDALTARTKRLIGVYGNNDGLSASGSAAGGRPGPDRRCADRGRARDGPAAGRERRCAAGTPMWTASSSATAISPGTPRRPPASGCSTQGHRRTVDASLTARI
jgi:hypothetical protein